VNIQATSSFVQYARDVLFDQPYYTIIEGEKEQEPDAGLAPLKDPPAPEARA
jgi:hypothetical protein